ncbi:MAG: UTP--glucose-1-phosphate uridylyltransferase [Streptosporangiaceae bacterium]
MAYTGNVTKAVIPVAGLGTRFLPATKATPKALMPIVDKPAIQYVVEEAAAAGLNDIVLITDDRQDSIAAHFSPDPPLEEALEAKGKTKELADVRAPAELARMSYVQQPEARGLGHAVLCAAEHVGDEPFAVLLGDDLIGADESLVSRMIDARNKYGGSIVALMEVPADQVSAYGVAAFKPTDDADIVAVTDLIEKPDASEAPSNWIIIGRYICDPAIFGVLRETSPGRGGEIQLTDALRTLAVADRTANADGGGVHGVLFRGRRFDTGNKQDFLTTTVEFACARPDLAPDFVPWLKEYVSTLD